MLSICTATAAGQISGDTNARIDATIASVYEAAAAKLPCKVSTSTARMLDRKEIDKCMEQARQRVDWDALSKKLREMRPASVPAADFAAAVESSLDRQALPYNRVFLVKKSQTLFPLTNAVLKYAPADALMNQPVFMLKGKQPIGAFAGIFYFERAGSIDGNTYRLALFQYTDTDGKIQTPADRLLLDSYGVPWEKIESKPGFRFPVEMISGLGSK